VDYVDDSFTFSHLQQKKKPFYVSTSEPKLESTFRVQKSHRSAELHFINLCRLVGLVECRRRFSVLLDSLNFDNGNLDQRDSECELLSTVQCLRTLLSLASSHARAGRQIFPLFVSLHTLHFPSGWILRLHRCSCMQKNCVVIPENFQLI
jgi:hypothetical protein